MKTISTLLFTLWVLTGQAQFDDLHNAFAASYQLESSGQYQAAIDTLHSVYQADHYPTNVRLGWLSYLAGEYPAAVNYYERAGELMPYAVEPLLGKAYPLWAMGQMAQAEQQYLAVLKKDPSNTLAKYRLALLAYEQKDYPKAHDWLEEVINLYPFDGPSLALYGWVYYQQGQLDKAKILFHRALLYDPNSTSAQQGLAAIE